MSTQNFRQVTLKKFSFFTKNKNLWIIWWAGVVYTVFLGIISQALDYIGEIGLVVSNTALAPAISKLYKEITASKKDKEIEKAVQNKSPIVRILCFVTAIIITFDVVYTLH